ncbi:uncharacterized protein LOC144156157 [Haemaphysalis longicornis]
MADQNAKAKVDLGLLEEDDEFEEFPAEEWTAKAEDSQDVNVWEDNWDDDNIEDDFSQQLRAELEKQGFKVGTGEPMFRGCPFNGGEGALATSSSLVGRGRSSRASLLSLRGDGGCLGEAPGVPAQEAASRSSLYRVKRAAAWGRGLGCRGW